MSHAPLNPDELAAAYLSSRDVPCPNCEYNRRGGVTASCPECGHAIAIRHEDGGWEQQLRHLAIRILTMLMVLCIAHALISGYSTINWLRISINGMMPGSIGYLYLLIGAVGLIAYLILAIVSFRVRRKTRMNQELTPKRVSSVLLAYLIVTIILWLAGFLSVLL